MSAKRTGYRAFLSIDKHALDVCLMEQAEIYANVSEAVALAEAERDTVQLEFDELYAELDGTLRGRPLAKGERLTEGSLKAELSGLPKIKSKHRELLEVKKEAKLWRALEKGFEQRADMLKKLVDLHLRSTFGYSLEAGVGQSRNAFVAQEAEQARIAIRERRKRQI